MPCTRQTAKKYKTRPGPPFHAGDCKGQQKPGNDEKPYTSVATAKGVYRWVPSTSRATRKKAGMKTYFTLDNGGRPYKVLVDTKQKKLSIDFRQFTDYEEKTVASEIPVFAPHTYKNIWIANGIEIRSGKIEPDFIGNSIVAQLSETRCIFAGNIVTEFTVIPGDSVDNATFISDVGNNAVPYPYLIGATHTYMLVDFVAIPNELFNPQTDRYSQFYGHNPGANGKKINVKRFAKKLKTKRIHTPR
jgi:hypothetical protein